MNRSRVSAFWLSLPVLAMLGCLVGCPAEPRRPEARAASTPSLSVSVGGIVARTTDTERRAVPAAQPDRPLQKGDTIGVSAATPLVAAAELNQPVVTPPVEFQPALPFRFQWKSPTEGEVTVTGTPAPSTAYRLRLRAGLRDAAGEVVERPAWGVEWPGALFVVRAEWSRFSDLLPAQPTLVLAFSHPVAAAEVARTVTWRDENGRSTASSVHLDATDDAKSEVRFSVTPREPLVAGHRYELLVEGTRCAVDDSPLAYVHVFPVGRTEPLRIETVAGFNQPKRGAFLEVKFNQVLDRASVEPKSLGVSPAVANPRLEVDGAALRVFGDFNPTIHYRVEIATEIRSRSGFGLEAAETWRARFHGKRAAVILPRSIVTTTARQGLSLDLVQVNTAQLHWKLARVPAEMMLTVRQRLDEYRGLDELCRDPVTNEWKQLTTELLVPSLALPVVAEGAFDPVDGDREVPRTVALAPGQIPEGIYLFEISGATNDGRIAGNRVLLFVNREFLVWKMTANVLQGRLFDVVTGEVVPHAGVQILASDGTELAKGETNEQGDVELPRIGGDVATELVVVRRGDALSAHFVDLSGGIPHAGRTETEESEGEEGVDTATPPELRQWLFSDRGIYRPGETLRAKGIVRAVCDGKLVLPTAGTPVAWQLARTSQGEPVATGETTLSAAGSWETEIDLPATLPVGHYVLRALGASCWVKVDEFRAPAFAAETVTVKTTEAGESRLRVLSRYFHGAPNARAAVRWRAVWTPHTPAVGDGEGEPGLWLSTSDYQSPDRELRRPRRFREAGEAERADDEAGSRVFEGTAVLDANGVAELSSRQPFPAARCLAAAAVSWEISVIAADGQTVDVEDDAVLPVAPAQPAVGLKAAVGACEIEVLATAVDVDGKLATKTPLKIELYRVAEKSVRENVSRHVVRYRNTPLYTPVAAREVRAPFRGMFPVEGAGRFVAVVSLAGVSNSPRASDDTTVVGAAPAEFAQWDDSTFEVKPDLTEYPVGATAHLALRAPFAGQAWVTVETDRLLFSNLVSLAGNGASVDVPVTAEMHPNAYVEIYLFRPQAQGELAERVGSCDFKVRRPETELQVRTELAAPKVEPGDKVSGIVTVTALGQPAAVAEVTLFAVDESVLQYGHWSLGDAAEIFFPAAAHEVETRSSLRQFGPRAPDDPLFQKGFLLGDGGGPAATFRRHFAALAFWQGNLRTNADGKAAFSFTAPDNLTAYRIVAVAHRASEQFGHGERLVEVARRLQAEPALPRFVRVGDEVDLRVIVRESEWPRLHGRVECTVDGATLLGAARTELDLEQSIPAPVAFRARVLEGTAPLRVRFAVQATGGETSRDAVEVTVPVKAARVLRRETVAGVLPAAAPDGWVPGEALPAAWKRGDGVVDLVVSRSPWLPLFDGLPRLLDYPHGCDEQISARVLAYGLMADLLEALPDAEARKPEYRRRVETGLAILARAQLPNGELPYWPGTKVGNAFVTIQTAWAAVEAERSGFKVSPRLLEGVQGALTRIARREDGVRVEPTLRAFALMVAAALDPNRKLRAESLELYQQRDALDDDGRALLALAMHRFGIMADEKRQLVAELGTAVPTEVFAPALLGSVARTQALRLYAQTEINGGAWTAEAREAQRQRIRELMESSPNFSTQENLWLLLAFRAFVKGEGGEGIGPGLLLGVEAQRSPDGRAAGWYGGPLKEFGGKFDRAAGSIGGTGSYLLRGAYQLAEPEQRLDRGFRLERVVRNLTDAKRDGSAAAPFALGDELLVTFRVLTERAQSYVALEESLPAALETVDPEYLRLTLREKIGAGEGEGGLELSHWEKRDDRTFWFFDTVTPGALAYSVVVRVTTSGSFQWPGAVISPMYDHRFSGMSEGSTIVVR